MDKNQSKTSFNLWLRVCVYLNKSTKNKQFKDSPLWKQINRLIFTIIRIISGFVLIIGFCTLPFPSPEPLEIRIYEKLVFIIQCQGLHLTALFSFIISGHFLKHRRKFINALNSLLSIQDEIRQATNSNVILLPNLFNTWLTINVFILSMQCLVAFSLAVHTIYLSLVLLSLTRFIYWSHLYVSLALIGSYMKMNEFLDAISVNMERHEVSFRTRELIEIFLRIHRVKKNMDTCHMIIFTYGCFSLMHNLGLMLILGMLQMVNKHWEYLQWLDFLLLAYELILLGLIQESLAKNEEKFRQHLMLLSVQRITMKSSVGRKRVDVVLLQHGVHSLCGRGRKCFQANPRFVFKLLTNVFVLHVLFWILRNDFVEIMTAV